MASFLGTNLAAIIIYMVVTMIMFKPVYVGFTIGVWIIMIELVIFFAMKYQQNNYSFMQFEAILCLIGILVAFLIWIIFMTTSVLKDETDESLYNMLMYLTIICSVVFFFGAIIGLLSSEISSKGTEVKKLSWSFYISSVSLLLIFIAIGLYILLGTSQGLIGILWLLVMLYIILFVFLPESFKKYMDYAFALIFVVLGTITMLAEIRNTSKIVAVTSFFAGFFLLTFGQFIRC